MTNPQQDNEQQQFRPLEELNYEQARDELVETVKILELGQMSLDESLKYWERGEALAAIAHPLFRDELLAAVERG